MHVSLDGYVANQKHEMNWISVDESMFEKAAERTVEADTVIYGRVTYQMMEDYWPTAADKPDATKHDREHSAWYKNVRKLIISRTMLKTSQPNTSVLSSDIAGEIKKLKLQQGKEIIIFGSPSVAHLLSSEDLIDDYWLFINPVLIGQGIPLFKDIKEPIKLKCIESTLFPSGVVCLHYKH